MPSAWSILLILAVAFGLSMFFFQLSGLGLWVMVLGIVLLIKGYAKNLGKSIPMPSVQTAKILGPVLVGVTLLMYGFFGLPTLGVTWESLTGGLITGTILTAPATPAQVQASLAACAIGLSDEAQDDASDVTLNAYDDGAAAGQGSVVDLAANCHFYKNGNLGGNYIALSTDTSAKTESTYWAISDLLYIYCGGSGHYTEPVEGKCIDSKTMPVVLNARVITTAATGVASAVFDEDGNALTAAGNSSTADYDITLGANQEKKFSAKWTSNVARKSYNFGGVATASFNDIDAVKPISGQGFTQVVEPNYLQTIAVGDEGGSGNQTLTYNAYVLDTPIMLNQWQSVRYDFTVKSGGNDPSASDNDFGATDAGIVCSLDMQYAKGHDGKVYLDIHDHGEADSEANVGYIEVVGDPVGGAECFVLSGN